MFLYGLFVVFAGAVMDSLATPEIATIVSSGKIPGLDPVGNVQVTFTDGHTEMWTRLGNCENPRVSSTGLVGWTTYKVTNRRGYPVNDTLVISCEDGRHKRFKANGTYPFIEDWNFAERDTAVVLKSRGEHGPADYMEYDLKTGKVIGHAHGLFGLHLPDWAQPYSD